MRYFKARDAEQTQSAAFRLYIGTGIQLINENLAAFVGAKRTLAPYDEFIGLKKPDKRTGDEIALDVIKRAGLELKT